MKKNKKKDINFIFMRELIFISLLLVFIFTLPELLESIKDNTLLTINFFSFAGLVLLSLYPSRHSK